MKSIKRFLGTGCLMLVATTMVAQKSDFGVWTSVEGSTKLNKKLELSLEGEYRTQDNGSKHERVSGAVNLSYKDKQIPFLKADMGYSIMSMYNMAETTIKYVDEDFTVPKHMNVDDPYWCIRHRATASLTGSFKWISNI